MAMLAQEIRNGLARADSMLAYGHRCWRGWLLDSVCSPISDRRGTDKVKT